MSEGGPDSTKTAVPLALTPPPAPQAVPPSPPEGRGTVAGGEAAEPILHKADPAARRKLLLLAPAGLAVLLGLAWWFDGYLDNLPVETTQQMKESTQAVVDEFVHALYASAVLMGLLAAYWFQLGRRIEAAPQYPMPQMRLFHDMRILRGEAKRKQARRSRHGAIAALSIAVLLLGAALYVPHRVVSEHPFLFRQVPPAVTGAAAHAP